MKQSFIRCLIAIAVLCGFTAVSGATPIDFRANVLDPPPGFSAISIYSTPFFITFSACASGELPGGLTADGCFAGVNMSGYSWNNLQLTFANGPALASQPATCGDPGLPFTIFATTDCGLSPDMSTYILTFTDGVINPGDFFFITEIGPDPSAFGTGTGTVVPEPTSLLLMATGLVAFGFLLKAERQGSLQSILHRQQ